MTKVGYKQTAEHKRKIAEASKFRKVTTETRKKISDSNKGKVRSDETRNNIRKGKTGKKFSIETHPNFGTRGMKFAKELYPNYGWRGRIMSIETKKRLSESLKGKNKGKKYSKEEYPNWGVRAFRNNLIIPFKDTSIEIKIQDFLRQLQIEFATHYYVHDIDLKYRCDIFIPSKKLIIECDGDYFHGNSNVFKNLEYWQIERRKKDELQTKQLIEKGYSVLRLWESDIRIMSFDSFKDKLSKYDKVERREK